MTYKTPGPINADLSAPVSVQTDALAWVSSPLPGVERRMLERDGGEVARATSLVRYAPGSRFDAHRHGGGEEFLVLEGVFSDENGDYVTGTYVRNPPGSSHAPFTQGGCTIFVKLCQMPAHETEVLRRDASPSAMTPPAKGCFERVELFRAPHETVAIEAMGPGAWRPAASEGEEILVLDGRLVYGGATYPAGTWLRRPTGSQQAISSPSGCRFWVKRGHLPKGA